MDTSKEYMIMCHNAKEIREIWKPVEGDFYYSRRNGNSVLTNDLIFLGDKVLGRLKVDCLWLPRQDQLQEMIIGRYVRHNWPPAASIVWDFSSFADPSEDVHRYCKSMEQLWLAFVMKEKYKKIWNEKKWIKEKKNE